MYCTIIIETSNIVIIVVTCLVNMSTIIINDYTSYDGYITNITNEPLYKEDTMLNAHCSSLMMIGGCSSGARMVKRYCWSWRSYARTLLSLYMFSYSSVATILVSVLRCTTVLDNQSFIFDYPSV